MNQLIKISTPLFLIIIYVIFTNYYDREIEPVHGYPIWMKSSSGQYSLQTSGLFFIGREGKKKLFLSANDNGRIDRISIDDSFSPPKFDTQVLHFQFSSTAYFFQHFAKIDFEDIVYDRVTNKILVSIEGDNGINDLQPPQYTNYKNTEGVYELSFNKTITDCDTLMNIRKLPMPENIFKFTNDNIAFEGMGITDNYYFLGLENATDTNSQSSDSTYLYIVERKTNNVKTITTKKLGIRSITGLCAQGDFKLYGIDREAKKIFCIFFESDFSIKKVMTKSFELPMPDHSDISMDKMTGVEAIALDDEGFIYTDIDPWSHLYKPNLTLKSFLSDEEKSNLVKLIPVFYKYKNPF
jgi:hypothetical protein